MTCPDPKETYTTPDGVVIPLGPGTNSNCGYSSLLYNEYPLLKKKTQQKLKITTLAFFILDTAKQVLWQTVQTQMKCRHMRHFIRVCTVFCIKSNLQGQKCIIL